MFPYLRTVNEFIQDCSTPKYCLEVDDNGHITLKSNEDQLECKYSEKNGTSGHEDGYTKCNGCTISRLVGWLIQRVNLSNWDSEVKQSEVYAWCKSLGEYMKAVFDGLTEKHKENLLVGLEYYLERETNGRADVMIIGKGPDGKDQILIIELKQWSGIRKLNETEEANIQSRGKEPANYCEAQVQKDENLEDLYRSELPTIQVTKYKESLSKHNEAFDKINVEMVVYLHNMCTGDDELKLVNNNGAKVFYKGQGSKLKEYIENDLFPECCQKIADSKDIVKKIREDYQNLKTEDIAEIITGEEKGRKKGEEYLRSDQKHVYNTLKKRVDDKNKKTIDIVYGVPGSGKTLIAACLANYVLGKENIKKLEWIYGGVASVNAIKNYINSDWLKSNPIFVSYNDATKNVGNDSDGKKVIIIDEANSLYTERGDFFKYLKSAEHIIIFGDYLQRLQRDNNNDKCILRHDYSNLCGYEFCDQYDLWTQFRCNAEDGYISWVDQVLEIEDVNSRGKSVKALVPGQKEDDVISLSELDFQPKILKNISEIGEILQKEQMLVLTGDWITDKSSKDELQGILTGMKIDYSYYIDKDNAGLLPKSGGGRDTVFIGNADTVQGVEEENVLIIIGGELYADIHGVHPVKDEKYSPKYWSIRKYRVLLTRATKKCYIYVVDKGLRERFLQY